MSSQVVVRGQTASSKTAGFDLSYPAGADIVPGLVTVTATNPVAGTSVPRGSKVTVSVSF